MKGSMRSAWRLGTVPENSMYGFEYGTMMTGGRVLSEGGLCWWWCVWEWEWWMEEKLGVLSGGERCEYKYSESTR